jgi:hypothetical protein
VATPKGHYKAAVIFITDIFGWEVDAARVWSDNMAKQVQLPKAAVSALLQASARLLAIISIQWS